MIYAQFYSSRRPNRRIILPGDERAHPGLYHGTENGNRREQGPREVEAEHWG